MIREQIDAIQTWATLLSWIGQKVISNIGLHQLDRCGNKGTLTILILFFCYISTTIIKRKEAIDTWSLVYLHWKLKMEVGHFLVDISESLDYPTRIHEGSLTFEKCLCCATSRISKYQKWFQHPQDSLRNSRKNMEELLSIRTRQRLVENCFKKSSRVVEDVKGMASRHLEKSEVWRHERNDDVIDQSVKRYR